MKTGADWYPRDPQKFLMGCIGLTTKEIAVYQITVDLMYANAGECPNDPKFISGYIYDMGPASVRKTLESLMQKGKVFITPNDRLSNKTVQKLAKTREETKEKRRESGKKGRINSGKSRAKVNKINGIDQASASTGNEPDKIRVYNIKNIQKDFDIFWNAYPKKDGKKDSKIVYSKAIKSGVDPDDILDGLAKYKTSKSFREGFVKNPKTWLNGEHWNDDNASTAVGTTSQADMYRNMQ